MILTHYYERARGPFKTLSDLSEEEAKQVMLTIDKTGTGDRRDFTNMNYLGMRKEVEDWLRAEFINKGGKPQRQNPHYFIIDTCGWLKEWFREPAEAAIPLSSFDSSVISFTYPDSMISLQLSQKKDDPKWEMYMRPYHGKVFMLDELKDVINEYGLPSEEKFRAGKAHQFEAYIEAQVWSDEPLKKFLG